MAFQIRDFTQRIRGLVLKRSIDLVAQAKVKVIDQDAEHAQFHVENNRDGHYHVEIRLNNGDVTFTHCDCPYRGVGLCKHTGAALLHLLVDEGFHPNDFEGDDFHFEDSEVVDVDANEETFHKLIKEISVDHDFELVKFLSDQPKDQLLTFILKYLEESEDIRLVVMAYIWFKSKNPKPPYLS